MAWFLCNVGSGGGGTEIPLIITCDSVFAGSTITATKSGAATQTATCPSSSPYQVTFNLPEDGTWTISGTYSGQPYTKNVTIVPYEDTLVAIPDGATVTPTDDVQIWLHCGNIWDKSYTTISEVLNDSTTFLALVSSNNAADYMVRSTTWASSVVADSTAMTVIGSNDYCAEALIADSTWCTSICNSTYFESVLNVKVPTMTSNTTPSGNCFGIDYVSGYEYYKAFDNSESTLWRSNSTSSESQPYVGYEFTQNVCIKKAMFIVNPTGTTYPKTQVVNLQYYDGDSWVDLLDSPQTVQWSSSGNKSFEFNIINNNAHSSKYRMVRTSSNPNDRFSVASVQFYGRA